MTKSTHKHLHCQIILIVYQIHDKREAILPLGYSPPPPKTHPKWKKTTDFIDQAQYVTHCLMPFLLLFLI